MKLNNLKFAIVAGLLQVGFVIVFAFLLEYDNQANAFFYGSPQALEKYKKQLGLLPNETLRNKVQNVVTEYYPMFQDVHVMIFIGFGFLMTFMKRYGYGAVGFNLLISCFAIQWASICHGAIHMNANGPRKVFVEIHTLLGSDFACAVVLISFGAVLGKTSPLQLLVMTMLEIPIFVANEFVGLEVFRAVDVGGSIFVHIFGAYFGMAVGRVLHKKSQDDNDNQGANYHSDLFSMIGTIFLWMFWPSFNSAIAPGDDQHRAVVNTYYALVASTVMTFVISALVSGENKFEMEHVQNATLAGGVAVGTSADLMVQPYGALLIGGVAGTLSVLGYKFLTPLLNKLKIHDTCGVHNLHGMPGVMAGLVSAIMCSLATPEIYGSSLLQLFPAMAPTNVTVTLLLLDGIITVEDGLNRSAQNQALWQLASIGVTLAMAIVGGVVVGLIMRLPIWDNPTDNLMYSDHASWEVPEEGYEPLIQSGQPVGLTNYTVTAVEYGYPVTGQHKTSSHSGNDNNAHEMEAV